MIKSHKGNNLLLYYFVIIIIIQLRFLCILIHYIDEWVKEMYS